MGMCRTPCNQTLLCLFIAMEYLLRYVHVYIMFTYTCIKFEVCDVTCALIGVRLELAAYDSSLGMRLAE